MRIFAKDLKKVEKWAKYNEIQIIRMKDAYQYSLNTNLDDVVYISPNMNGKTIKSYDLLNARGGMIVITDTNTQKELIENLNKIFKVEQIKRTESEPVDNTPEFINKIKFTLKNNIENEVFDTCYKGDNYNDIVNNMTEYITLDIVKKAIESSKDYIKEFCKIYNQPCKLEVEGNKIYMNSDIIVY